MKLLGHIDEAKDIVNKEFVESLLGDYQPLITSAKPLSYSLVSGTPTLLSSFTNDLGFIDSSALVDYLPTSSYTAADILAKLQSVDGVGSGLDADLLDGLHSDDIVTKAVSYNHKKAFIRNGVGWYKLAMLDTSGTYMLSISGWYNNGRMTSATFIINTSFDVVRISQIGKAASTAITDKIRITKNPINRYTFQVEIHVGTAVATGEEILYKVVPLEMRANVWGVTMLDGSLSTDEWDVAKTIDISTDVDAVTALSSTKLATGRKIWGQEFDGTANISGNMYLDNGRSISFADAGGISRNILAFGSALQLGYDTCANKYSTYLYGYSYRFHYGESRTTGMLINSSGGVTIGASDLAGTSSKLYVDGNTYINGQFYLGNNNITGAINLMRAGANYIWANNTGGVTHFGVADKGTKSSANATLTINASQIHSGSRDNEVSLGTSSFRWSDIHSVLATISDKVTINNIPIYKSQDDVLYIDGNLAVRGGITMYATDAIDVPSIIDALPSATYDTKGMAAFNPNDFSVVDGYVSYIGKGGVDESVLVDYLPLSGGQMTGNIGYTLDRDKVYGLSLPAAGGTTYSDWGSFIINSKSFIGSAMNETSNAWYNVISLRHYNGYGGDGQRYGMYLISSLTDNSADLKWNRQAAGDWQGERVILDSVNWSQYVTAADGGNYLPLSGGTLNGSLSIKSSYAGIISVYRTIAGGGAWIDYYASNQSSSKWRVGADYGLNEFTWETPDGQYPCRIFYNKTYGIRFEIGQKFSNVQTYTEPKRATLTLISTTDNPTDLIMGANNYDWSITARGSSDDYFLGFYSARNGQYVTRMYRNGDVLVTGGITMYSDIRKKTRLQDVELTLQQIAEAPLIEHYYNSDSNKTTHVGSIAQYWASMNDWFCKLDGEGYYTMEIQNAALASAISIARELQRYESKTDKKIRLLKKRIGELEDEIEKLKMA